MLAKKLKQTKDLMKEVDELQKKKNEYDDYKQFWKLLKERKDEILDFIEVYKLLRRLDVNKFNLKDIDELIKTNKKIIFELENDSIPDKYDLFTLEDKINNYKKQLKRLWEEYVNEKTSEIINTLKNIKMLFSNPREIKKLIKKTDELKNKWPLKETDLNKLEEISKEGNKIINSLNVNNEIQNFLNLVSNGDAQISDLSPQIIEWLENNNFDDKLKITFY